MLARKEQTQPCISTLQSMNVCSRNFTAVAVIVAVTILVQELAERLDRYPARERIAVQETC